MRLALILGGVIVLAAVWFGVYIRFAPTNPEEWHLDPSDVSRSSSLGSYLLDDTTGDGPAPRFTGTAQDVMTQFDLIALSTPRVQRLMGDPASGHITYVARSLVFGFPDFISVRAIKDGDQTALTIYARLRYGSADMGVNQRRVDGWLSQMRTARALDAPA